MKVWISDKFGFQAFMYHSLKSEKRPVSKGCRGLGVMTLAWRPGGLRFKSHLRRKPLSAHQKDGGLRTHSQEEEKISSDFRIFSTKRADVSVITLALAEKMFFFSNSFIITFSF